MDEAGIKVDLEQLTSADVFTHPADAVAYGLYMAPQRTRMQRLWRWLGYRYHLGPLTDDEGWEQGFLQNISGMKLDWRDRLRVLLSGHIRIVCNHSMDQPVNKVRTRMDWEIVEPGGKRGET
jgi:hypothetical protein